MSPSPNTWLSDGARLSARWHNSPLRCGKPRVRKVRLSADHLEAWRRTGSRRLLWRVPLVARLPCSAHLVNPAHKSEAPRSLLFEPRPCSNGIHSFCTTAQWDTHDLGLLDQAATLYRWHGGAVGTAHAYTCAYCCIDLVEHLLGSAVCTPLGPRALFKSGLHQGSHGRKAKGPKQPGSCAANESARAVMQWATREAAPLRACRRGSGAPAAPCWGSVTLLGLEKASGKLHTRRRPFSRAANQRA